MRIAAGMLAATVIAVLVSSCAVPEELPEPQWTAQSSPALPRLGVSIIAALPHTDNAVVSPLSLAAALDLIAIGGDDPIRIVVAEATGIGSSAEDQTPTLAHWDRQLTSLAHSAGIELELANAVWADSSASLAPEYAQAALRDAGAPTARIDLASESAVTAINDWAGRATRGHIPMLLDARPGKGKDTVTVTDALYFRGGWTHPFDPNLTTRQQFHRPGAPDIGIDLMLQSGEFSYRENSDFQAIKLYFGHNALFNVVVLLPKRADADPAALINNAGSELSDALQGHGYAVAKGTVMLPRLRIIQTSHPLELLRESDVVRAITIPKAMTRMFVDPPEQLRLESIQRVMMELDESGATAAAATAITAYAGSAPLPSAHPPFKLRADHPFWFVLTEARTDTVLIVGIVRRP